MTCAEWDDRLMDYLYQELGADERQRLEAHLAGCEACRGEVAGLSRTLGQARQALRGPLSEEAPARVRAAVLNAARGATVAGAGVQPVRAAAPPADGGLTTFWAWVKKPWFFPAFAAVSALAIFMISRPALMKPLPSSMDEASGGPPEEPARIEGEAQPAQPAYEATSAPAPEPLASAGGRGLEKEARQPAAAPRPSAVPARQRQPGARRSAGGARSAVAGGMSGAGAGAAGRDQAPVVRDAVPLGSVGASAPRRATPTAAPPPGQAPARKQVYDQEMNEASVAEARRPPEPRFAVAPPAPAPAAAAAGPNYDEAYQGVEGAPADPQTVAASSERKGRVGAAVGGAPAAAVSAKAARAAEPSKVEADDRGTEKARMPAAPPAPRSNLATPPPAAAPAAAPAPAGESGADSLGARAVSNTPPLLPLAELRQRAERATRDGQHADAAKHYRELLRRFPTHRDAPQWRRRLDAALKAASSR